MESVMRNSSDKFCVIAFSSECRGELNAIADWWCDNSIDEVYGGFKGEVSDSGEAVPKAEKSIVLNTRILWFFSELCLYDARPKYRFMADRAYSMSLIHI